MKYYLLAGLLCVFTGQSIAKMFSCLSAVSGYKVVSESIYPFILDKEKACFFAFYTKNPDPIVGTGGNGNPGDSLWYGYYMQSNPSKIYEFPKPDDTFWSNVCTIRAISFQPMHGNKKRDVTVIGACDKQNAINYNFPFVWVWDGKQYQLDTDVYERLYGQIFLTVEDVRKYIKSHEYYYYLEKRYAR